MDINNFSLDELKYIVENFNDIKKTYIDLRNKINASDIHVGDIYFSSSSGATDDETNVDELMYNIAIVRRVEDGKVQCSIVMIKNKYQGITVFHDVLYNPNVFKNTFTKRLTNECDVITDLFMLYEEQKLQQNNIMKCTFHKAVDMLQEYGII